MLCQIQSKNQILNMTKTLKQRMQMIWHQHITKSVILFLHFISFVLIQTKILLKCYLTEIIKHSYSIKSLKSLLNYFL